MSTFEMPMLEAPQDVSIVYESGIDMVRAASGEPGFGVEIPELDAPMDYKRTVLAATAGAAAIFAATAPAYAYAESIKTKPDTAPIATEQLATSLVDHLVVKSLRYQKRTKHCGFAPIRISSPPNEPAIENAGVGIGLFRMIPFNKRRNKIKTKVIVRHPGIINSKGITIPLPICKTDIYDLAHVSIVGDNYAGHTFFDTTWDKKHLVWRFPLGL